MDLRSLRYFAEIATLQSYSRAAARLHRSQPALSRCIRDLESELGIELFTRVGRGITLSTEGRHLLAEVQQLLLDAEKLTEHARLLRTGKSLVLRVGAAANTIERAMPGLMQRYREQWPNVEIFLRPGGGTALLASLERGEIDLAFTRHVNSDFLESKIAFPTHLIAVLHSGHPRASQSTITVEDLEGERLLVAPTSFSSRMLLDAAFSSARLRPRIALETNELNALIALAEAAQGIAVVPSTVDTAGRAVKVLPIRFGKKLLGSWVAIVWDRRREQPEHSKVFADLGLKLLKQSYPGKEMKLPPLKRVDSAL